MTNLAIKGGKSVIPNGLKIKWPVFDGTDKRTLIEIKKFSI